MILFVLSLLAALALAGGAQAAGPPSVGLGTAESYGVLAGDTITNTGATTINGDLGLHAGTAVTGAPTVNGASNVANAAALQAKTDLRTAYLNAEGRSGPILLAGGALGGKTLAPGLYKDDGAPASLGLAGGQTLTLEGDASSVWIFQSASTLIAEVGSSIVLAGGAQACNVFWQVGSSATLKVGTSFVGTVMAHTSITAQTSVTVAGRLFAGASPSGAGALTLDTNTITKAQCATAPVTTTTTVATTTAATTGTSAGEAADVSSSLGPVRRTGVVDGGPVGGPSECDDDLTAIPPFISTAVCTSLFLKALQTGDIEVVVSPATSEPDPSLAPDLNLFVFACDATGCFTPAVLSATGPTPGKSNEGSDERVIFEADTGVVYEVVTVPGLALVPVAYNSCAAYNDACVDPEPTEPPGLVPAAQFFATCDPDTTDAFTGTPGSRHVTGGGYFKLADGDEQHFSTHVNRKDGNFTGVLNFRDGATGSGYYSKPITCAFFNDTDKTVRYKGTATKQMQSSDGSWHQSGFCFTARAYDGGDQGGPVDELKLSFFPLDTGLSQNDQSDDTCNTSPLAAEVFGGPIYEGQVEYHLYSDDQRG